MPKTSEADWAPAFALVLAETGVRNSALEQLHMPTHSSSANRIAQRLAAILVPLDRAACLRGLA